MGIQPGQELLHYRIVDKIGEGGMGEVWKAVDTTLDREVAIKFIPPQFAADPERLGRFVGEAKMLAALNHPNIAAVYGLHELDGTHFIVMELIPGEDLAQRLERGPLAPEDAVEVARQVADALEAAHDQGVVHRDLKPANVIRAPDGKIKVLDFGLAKALSPETSSDPGSLSLSPTVTSAGTIAGTLLGTAAYMSPEQAKGRPVDRRADIWAFGVVLHEMLTGKKLFDEETISETLAAVLRDDISVEGLPANTPAAVTSVLARCLERDPRSRLRDIGEARIALSPETLSGSGPGLLSGTGTVTAAAEAAPRKAPLLPWILVALLAFVAAFALWRGAGRSPETTELLTLVAPIPEELQLPVNQMGVMALSPDGKTLAVVLVDDSENLLHVRRLNSPELTPMPGTEGAATPFFSPDGQWIAFFADDKLKKVPVSGGSPVTLCDADGSNRGGDWGTDDTIVFSPHYTKPLMRVPGAGGEATPLTEIDQAAGERTHRWPHAVPNEDVVLFTVGTLDSPESYDDAQIEALRPSTGERKTVLKRASMARYLPSGHLVFGRDGFLFAVPFDIDALEVVGQPVPVMEDVSGMRNSGVVHAGFAANGMMAYVAGSQQASKSRLVWRNRDGTKEPLPAPEDGYVNPRISRDGKRIALEVLGATTADIWTFQIEQQTRTRLTFEGDNTRPIWSPDGRRIAFASVRDNALMSLYVKAADGGGQAEMLYSPERMANAGQVMPAGWTADGRTIIIEYTNENGVNLATYSEEDGETTVLLETPAVEVVAVLSPNGKWLAYASDEAGAFQVFVRAFGGGGGKWQISTAGGNLPRWSPDGRELFYRRQTGLYSVRIDDSDGSFSSGRPEIVFDDLAAIAAGTDYDVLSSERFLLIEDVDDDSNPAGVTVVVGWAEEMKRKVGE